MGKVFTVIGVLVVGVIGLAGIAFFTMSSGAVTATNGFFGAIRSGDKQLTYSYLSEQFKAGTKAEQFDTFVRDSRLGEIVGTSWPTWSVKNNTARLEGSGTTASGGVIPLTVDLVEEHDRWLIFAVSTNFTNGNQGTTGTSSKRAVPNQQALMALVQNTTAVFAQSIKQHSMALFHSTLALDLQQAYDVAQLDQGFDAFYKAAGVVAELPDRVPQFVKATVVNELGQLVTQGRYGLSNVEYQFNYVYTYEGIGWKLVGIDMSTKPYPQQQIAQTKTRTTRSMQPRQVVQASFRSNP